MERRLAAILAADVVGYSRLMAANDTATLAALKATLDQVIEPDVARRNGRIVKTMGDGVLVEFASVVDAVECAVAIQTTLAARNAALPDERRIVFRIGINIGDIIVEDDDIFGDGVNVAARLEGLAEPGGICVSQTVFNHLKNKVELDFEDVGAQRFKNIAEPVHVYRVLTGPPVAGRTAATVGARTAGAARRPRLWAAAAVAGVALAVVAGVLWWQRPSAPREPPASTTEMAFPLPEKPSIAVLPFANLSGDAEQEYFADGLTDDLITDLSRVSGLFVIARNSVFTYKGRAVKVQEVAEELGVRYVLEGSARRVGDTVRINAQLIDALTGRHVWAERYDRAMSDIFAVQDEVIGRIVAALAVELTDAEEIRIARRPTENLEAYDLYLRAERALYGYGGSRRRAALALFQKAIELDAEFSDAYAGMARAAADVWRWDINDVMPGPVARRLAYDTASRALALDPENGRAVAVLAKLQAAEGRHEDALASARLAVSLDPNNAAVHDDLAGVLVYAGLQDEGLAEMETALRLDPKPPPYFWADLGWALFHGRQYERAIEPLERALDGGVDYLETLAMTYARLGRDAEARNMVDRILERFSFANLAYFRVIYRQFRREADREHAIESLRLAGIPEWPFGYEPPPAENRVGGPALRDLISDRTWIGRNRNDVPTFREYRKNGTVATRDAGGIQIGKAWVDGDMLCTRFEAVLVGREFCHYVYRNPEGSPEEMNEYIEVSPLGIGTYAIKR